MGTIPFLLSLFSLLHMTYGNPVDCSTEIKGIPIDFSTINGVWNVELLFSAAESNFTDKHVLYVISTFSANEKEANLSTSFNPLSIEKGEITVYRVANDDPGDLTYEFVLPDGTEGTVTIIQPHPDSLFLYHKERGVFKSAALYYKKSFLPSNEQERFRQWSQCNNLLHMWNPDSFFNYAEHCYGLLEKSDDLDNIEDSVSMNVLVKSLSSEDVFSSMKMLYTANLEILHQGDNYSVREFTTKIVTHKNAEFNYIKGSKTDDIKISTYKTEKDLLLLGVRKGSSRFLYLVSKTLKVKQEILDLFWNQAKCFGTGYLYFVPGIRESDHGVSCFGHLEDVTPLPVNKSLGRWNLVISAQRLTESLLKDVANEHTAMDLREEGGKYFLNKVTVVDRLPVFEKNIPVEVKDGYLSFSGSSKPILRHFNRGCALHSSEGQDDSLFLYCHSEILAFENRILFSQYAVCQKYTNLVIRRKSALPCLNISTQLKQTDPEKLSGKWKVEASASEGKEVKVPTEIDFTVQDQQVIVSQEDGTKTTMEKNDKKFQDIVDRDHFLVFYQSIGDSLFAFSGRLNHFNAMYLLSKSSQVDPAEVAYFKEFALCSSFTDVKVHE